MSRILLAIATGLIILPWQASLPVEADVQQAIRARIISPAASGQVSEDNTRIATNDLLGKVYARRDFAPAWEQSGQVGSLLEAVRASYLDGLNPADYNLTGIEQVQQSVAAGRELSASEQATFDLMLTDSLIRLVYHLRYGKVDLATNAPPWASSRLLDDRDPSTVIAEIIDADILADAISSITPRDPDYDRLKVQLHKHRLIASAGGWPEVSSGPTIRPGASDPRLDTLARRLAVSDDLADARSTTATYHPALEDAVRRFQARHGLEVDGLVGRATLRALNVSIERRIDQIRLNLERTRWRFNDQFEDFILVNIAGFRAYVIREREKAWTTKVMAGAIESQTPLFQAVLTQIVFNPTWTVPFSIASEEMLPRIKEDPGYLEREGFQLFDGDGNEVDSSTVNWSTIGDGSFPFTLVQQPGTANQLGQVKFVLPNEDSVYMHDTPAKYLFNRASRALSHGCLRVDAPIKLAELILGREGWMREQIDAQIESEETSTVSLSVPLPVVIRYWTAEVDDQGEMYFYDDIYGRDAAVLASLKR